MNFPVNISLFRIGSVGVAVIFIIFLFYFATILILDAQINTFFFEDYKPLANGLGTYLSQMYTEHLVDLPWTMKPLHYNHHRLP